MARPTRRINDGGGCGHRGRCRRLHGAVGPLLPRGDGRAATPLLHPSGHDPSSQGVCDLRPGRCVPLERPGFSRARPLALDGAPAILPPVLQMKGGCLRLAGGRWTARPWSSSRAGLSLLSEHDRRRVQGTARPRRTRVGFSRRMGASRAAAFPGQAGTDDRSSTSGPRRGVRRPGSARRTACGARPGFSCFSWWLALPAVVGYRAIAAGPIPVAPERGDLRTKSLDEFLSAAERDIHDPTFPPRARWFRWRAATELRNVHPGAVTGVGAAGPLSSRAAALSKSHG